MPSGRLTSSRRFGGASFFASAALAGNIASRSGNPIETPAERRKVRRSMRRKGIVVSSLRAPLPLGEKGWGGGESAQDWTPPHPGPSPPRGEGSHFYLFTNTRLC